MTELTDAQLTANRANAKLSTGPRTEEGKKRVSLNATQHGLAGRVVVLPSEDLQRYLAFSKEIVDSLRPGSPLERELAQTIADQQWRLNRVRSIEDALLGPDNAEEGEDGGGYSAETNGALAAARAFRDRPQVFVNLSTYEQRIHRMLKETLRQLQEMQAARKTEQEAEMKEAIRLYRLNKMLELPYDPQQDGFVYSKEELEAAIDRQQRHLASLTAMGWNFDLKKVKANLKKWPEPKGGLM